MRKLIPSFILLAGLLTACSNTTDRAYLITDTQVGLLTKGTQIGDLETIFEGDSLVTDSGTKPFKEPVEIYNEEGKLKLIAIPEQNGNTKNPVSYVEIRDERYQTKEGLGPKSLFKDFKKQYEIDKLSTGIAWVVVSFKNTPLYITIDKEELSEEVRYDLNAKVELTQIPDNAKIKLMMMAWDYDKENN